MCGKQVPEDHIKKTKKKNLLQFVEGRRKIIVNLFAMQYFNKKIFFYYVVISGFEQCAHF